ncbi:hypothetical protein [Psychroserpens algicola]|uniref:hypothetical protein n=1 Tax=Psychroserpens algicola TaxID=1719034 RepID=UPI0019544F18|nr:hypothetical protein [Psychroserpens algicola]
MHESEKEKFEELSKKMRESLLKNKGKQFEHPEYRDLNENSNSESEITETEFSERIKKGIEYIAKLSEKQRERILELLKEVQKIQKSELSTTEKTSEIKNLMWTNQSVSSKLLIGGFLGTIAGLLIFGTGGIGIAGLGSAIGVWGFLAGTAGGVLISSLIQNFEKNKSE